MVEEDVDAFYGLCISHIPNPHQALVHKELWESLSDKAMTAIRIIVDSTPKDFRSHSYGNVLYSHPTMGESLPFTKGPLERP